MIRSMEKNHTKICLVFPISLGSTGVDNDLTIPFLKNPVLVTIIRRSNTAKIIATVVLR